MLISVIPQCLDCTWLLTVANVLSLDSAHTLMCIAVRGRSHARFALGFWLGHQLSSQTYPWGLTQAPSQIVLWMHAWDSSCLRCTVASRKNCFVYRVTAFFVSPPMLKVAF